MYSIAPNYQLGSSTGTSFCLGFTGFFCNPYDVVWLINTCYSWIEDISVVVLLLDYIFEM